MFNMDEEIYSFKWNDPDMWRAEFSGRRLIKLQKTCESCPAQWEGTLDNGAYVLVRVRHGQGRIDLDGITVASWEHKDPMQGEFSDEMLRRLLFVLNIDYEGWL